MRDRKGTQSPLPGMESEPIYSDGYRAGRASAKQELADARRQVLELRERIRALTVEVESGEWAIPATDGNR